ncbi:MAG: Holliday junction resolvase Hjc [Candidatus Marsarchaeota archaeon]|nr:Holliday junction resolvase Hjc [Candidatus Marsarchaeota archaeon]MCL5115319.1 Holliday junction resolvase Hjc [Candidatus Marsarchaeota archaeon]
MTRYTKGARSERELLSMLHDNGYSVVRSAGSGVNSISPDLIAIKKGRGLAFECKAWDSTSLSIEPEKYRSLEEWRDNAGMDTYIAWRMNGGGWFFMRLNEMTRTEKNYTITMKMAKKINRKIDMIMV